MNQSMTGRLKVFSLPAFIMVASQLIAADQQLNLRFADSKMASKGELSITYLEFHAFLEAIPESQRAEFLESPDRFTDFLNSSFITKSLAEAAIKDDALDDSQTVARLYVSALKELAIIYRDDYVSENLKDDYSARARERFLANRSKYVKPATATFDQILLVNEDVDPDILNEKIERIKAEYENGRPFEALVSEYSQDPSASETNGRFRNVQINRLEPRFAEALSTVQANEISTIESSYGVHLVVMRRFQPERRAEFEDVQEELQNEIRAEQEQKIMREFVDEIAEEPLELQDRAVERILERYEVKWD